MESPYMNHEEYRKMLIRAGWKPEMIEHQMKVVKEREEQRERASSERDAAVRNQLDATADSTVTRQCETDGVPRSSARSADVWRESSKRLGFI